MTCDHQQDLLVTGLVATRHCGGALGRAYVDPCKSNFVLPHSSASYSPEENGHFEAGRGAAYVDPYEHRCIKNVEPSHMYLPTGRVASAIRV